MNQLEAYWLGFLCADGHLMAANRRGGNRRIYLELQLRDIDHVQKFLATFESSPRIIPKIRYRQNSATGAIVGSAVTTIGCNKLKFINQVAFEAFKRGDPDLIKDFTSEEFRHWLRGFVDGDGSIAFKQINRRRPKTPMLMAVSVHKDILGAINNRITEICLVSPNTIKINNRKPSLCYRISWSGTRARDIMRSMYYRAKIYLDRKHDAFVKCDEFRSMFEVSPL